MFNKYPLKQIGPYAYSLKEPLLGKTRTSEVFNGFNTLTDDPVAIKTIKLASLDKVQQSFLSNEIQILFSLKKALHIVKVIEVFQTKTEMCIVMEKCTGDLQKLLKQKAKAGKGLEERQAMKLMNQILIGYKKIYKNGIIHRDLKLANIFLKGQQVRIADFGYAIKVNKTSKFGITKTSENVGSPMYMAPECLANNIYSYKSDVWALGIIYFQLLFGQIPWMSKSQKQLKKEVNSFDISQRIPFKVTELSEQFLKRTICKQSSARFDPEELINISFPSSDNWKDIHASSALTLRDQYETLNSLLNQTTCSRIRRTSLKNLIVTPKFYNSKSANHAQGLVRSTHNLLGSSCDRFLHRSPTLKTYGNESSITDFISLKNIKVDNEETSNIFIAKKGEKNASQKQPALIQRQASKSQMEKTSSTYNHEEQKTIENPNKSIIQLWTKNSLGKLKETDKERVDTEKRNFVLSNNLSLSFKSPKKNRSGIKIPLTFQNLGKNSRIVKKCAQQPTNINKEQMNTIMNKNVSDLLKYEVHFCRFLIKIVGRIMQASPARQGKRSWGELVHILQDAIEVYVLCRTSEVKELKRLDLTLLKRYKDLSPNYIETVDYASTYNEKYNRQFRRQLKEVGRQTDYKETMIRVLQQFIENNHLRVQCLYYQNRRNWQTEIIIADYLITLKQFLKVVDCKPFNFTAHPTSCQMAEDRTRINLLVNKLKTLKNYQVALRNQQPNQRY